MTDNLPRGWVRTTLGELGNYINGRSFKKSEWSKSGIPIIRIQNLTNQSNGFNYFNGQLEERYIVEPGDLLVSWAATLGAYIWRGDISALNQHIFRVESKIDKWFHYYLIQHKLKELTQESHGSGMVHVPRSKFDNLEVRLPPLAEQRRIVEALERYFSHLDRATRCLQESARKNYILGKSLNLIPNATRDTEMRRLGDVVSSHRGGWSRASRHLVRPDAGTGYLKMNNISPGGQLDLSQQVFVAASPAELSRYRLEVGDVLFNSKNSAELVGKTAVVDTRVAGWVYNENITRIRFDPSINPSFAAIQMNSPSFRRHLNTIKKASTNVAAVYIGTLMESPFWAPDLIIQNKLVASYRENETIRSALAERIILANEQADALRLSLLRDAFSGRLTRQFATDEPARELMARITAERATVSKQRRTHRNTAPSTTSTVPEGTQGELSL